MLSREALDALRQSSPGTPAIVVYGARLRFEAPVLMHVFPSQERVQQDIRTWAKRLRQTRGDGYVVVAHMPREIETYDLPASPGGASIRNQRIDLIAAGIQAAGLHTDLREVPDYAAARAIKLVKESEEALGFLLADELCLGVLHQLEARGIAVPARRLVGFDDSAHSREFGISSFSQHIPRIGERTVDALAGFFRQPKAADWPAFREESIRVELIAR